MTKKAANNIVYQPESWISTITQLQEQCDTVWYFYKISDNAKVKLLHLFNEFNTEILVWWYINAPYSWSYKYHNAYSNSWNSLWFKSQITKRIKEKSIPTEILQLWERMKAMRDEWESTFFIDNIIVDQKPVEMSFKTPTQDKYRKDNFINEMMIELLTQLSWWISIWYQQRSNGDIPQDVIPTQWLADKQTQRNMLPFKDNKALGKHQDRAYSNPKPEGLILNWIHTAWDQNTVLTTICELKEFKKHLSKTTIEILSIPMFTIVPDEFTLKTTKIDTAKVWPVLHQDWKSMTYYTWRVIWDQSIKNLYWYTDQAVKIAIEELETAMSKVMKYVNIWRWDSLKISNTAAVHWKLANIEDPQEAMKRYLLKQYLLSQKTFDQANTTWLLIPWTHIVKETAK